MVTVATAWAGLALWYRGADRGACHHHRRADCAPHRHRHEAAVVRTEPVSGARDLAPVVEDIRSCGATSLRAIAGELNARGMLTRRGGRWHVSTVMNLLDRLGEQRCRNPG